MADDITPLLEQAHARQRFDDFYLEHAEPITRALAVTLGDRELAEDATNEAMARALQRWRKVSAYQNPAGWVYRVALNWALSWLRKRRRERDRPLPVSPVTSSHQLDDEVAAAITDLSVEHRVVVVCRYFFDWSVADTAAALNIPEGTVKSRLARALDNIRTTMETGYEL